MKKGAILLLVLMTAAWSTASGQEFQFPITVTDGASAQLLTLGVHPDGTDGFDSGLDELAPPPPLPGAFDARFRIGAEDYFTDIRANDLAQKTFTMRYQVAADQGPITLTWDPTGLAALGSFEIVDDVTGTLFGPLDMTTTNTLDVSSAGGLLDDGLRILVVPNAPPTAGDDAAGTNEDEAVVIDVLDNDSDVDGTLDPATVTVTGGPSDGTITGINPTTGEITYLPDPDFDGIDMFTYTVDDDDGATTNEATVTVTVNDAPEAADDVETTGLQEAVAVDVLANDTDSDGTLDPATVTVTGGPADGTITGVNPTTGAITYDPAPGFAGIDAFTYTVDDDDGATSGPATVSVLVDPVEISGAVVRPDLTTPVEGVTLGVTGDLVQATASAVDGSYSLTVGRGGDYTVTPFKDDDPVGPNNGVNVLDVALVRQHILSPGSTPLSSAFRIIAGDVDASDAINVLDVVSMRQLILAQITSFGAGLWRFVSSAYVFSDPTNPLAEAFAEARDYTDLASDQADQDFLAVRLGDVDESWAPAGAASKYPAVSGTVRLAVGPPEAVGDGAVLVPVRVRGFEEVGGVQFTLEWDAGELAYGGVAAYGLPGLSATHFGEAHVGEGVLTVAWDDPALAGVSLPDGSSLFAVGFRVLDRGAAANVEITSGLTAMFAHRGGELAPLALEVAPIAATAAAVPGRFALEANYPNPFNPATRISYALPEPVAVRLRVYNALGQVVATLVEAQQEAGRYQVGFDAARLANGVYFYTLQAGAYRSTRTMTVLK